MKYHNSTTEYNCGIDLHARQMYVCVMDRQGKKLVHTNVKDNDFKFFLKLVADQKSRLPRVCAAADGARYRPDLGPDHSPRNRRHSPLPQRQRLPLLLSPGQRHGASAGKIKGLRGAKLGNPCLRWAFGEAAVIAKRDHAIIGPLAQRLEAQMQGNKFKANTVVAIKLARAVYFMLKNKTVFEPERLVAALARN